MVGTKRLTYLQSIKKHCFECSGWSYKDRENCEITDCPLYPYRFGKLPKIKPKLTPLKSIAKYCLECNLSNYKERKLCENIGCFLHIYRLGKNPFIKRNQNGRIFNQSAVGSTFLK